MSSIDDRIVNMRFNNRQFERGVSESTKSLDGLKKALDFDGATKGLSELDRAGKRFSLAGMAEAVENISSRFSVLGAIGFTVIQDLTRASLDFARRVGRAVLDPIFEGGKRRALNLEQAMFQFEGLRMDVEAAMEAANNAVLGTAFGLDEAAKAAAQFGASGMDAGEDMQSALRGISGVAAMTSSSYEDIAHIFTTVSGNGRLMGNQLLQLSGRGLNAAAAIADFAGKSEEEIRQMVTKGEVSFEMFYQAMDAAFGEHATKANETFTGSLSNMRAALSRIGADFISPSLVRFRDIFNSLSPLIDNVRAGLKPLVEEFESLSEVQTERITSWIDSIDVSVLEDVIPDAIQTAKNVVEGLLSVLRPLRDAFVDIFPPITADRIREIAESLKNFTSRFKMGEESADRLRRTFRGLFAVLDIGWTVLSSVVGMFARLFGVAFEGSSSFLGVTASIGDFLVSVRDAIKDGGILTTVIGAIETALVKVVEFFRGAARGISNFFSLLFGAGLSGAASAADRIAARAEPLSRLGEVLSSIWSGVLTVLQKVGEILSPIIDSMVEWLSGVGSMISDAFADADWSLILDIINTAFLGGIVYALRNFISGIGDAFSGGFGLSEVIENVFGSLTGALSALQSNLQAGTLMKIAGAVGILTASVLVLSLIDSAKLASALAGLTVMFTELMAVMAVFSKIAIGKGMLRLPVLTASMIVLGTAVLIFASAVKKLSGLDWGELLRGMTGLAGILAVLTVTAKAMSGNVGGIFIASAAMIAMAAAVRIMAGALEKLSELSWSEIGRGMASLVGILASMAIFNKLSTTTKGVVANSIGMVLLASAIRILSGALETMGNFSWGQIAKGLTGLAGSLVIIALAMSLMPKSMLLSSAALVVVGAALKIISSALSEMGGMTWGEVAKGLVALAGSLAIIAGAMLIMPSALPGAAALLIVAASLPILARSLKSMGDLSWGQIARALVTLAGSLLIIAGAMILMPTALPGAAALFVVSAALTALTPALIAMGNMSWGEIARGLTMLAGTFLVIGVAGAALTPVIPTLLGLAAALTLLGVAVLATGAGILALSVGLTGLAAAGAAGVTALVNILEGILSLIPMAFEMLAEGLIGFAKVIGEGAPSLIGAIASLLSSLIQAIREVIPEALEAFVEILLAFLEAVDETSPEIIDTLFKLTRSMLEELEANVDDFTRMGFTILIAILDGIANNAGRVGESAALIVGEFILGLGRGVSRVADSGVRLLINMFDRMSKYAPKVVRSATRVVTEFLAEIGRSIPRITNAGLNMIVQILNGMAKGVRKHSPRIRAAGWNLAKEIINGMTGGLFSGISNVTSAAATVASRALSAAKYALGIKSPSTEFFALGKFMDEGMANGLNRYSNIVGYAAEGVGKTSVDKLRDSLKDSGGIFDEVWDMDPSITPVLDLSEIRRDAGLIGDLIDQGTIVDYNRASTIARDRRAQEEVVSEAESIAKGAAANIIFNQTNNSPKALTTAEIYRRTKNQLSVIKREAGV